jgi:hypothetical protein
MAARGGGDDGGGNGPSLATSVPGIPRRSFFLDENREHWEAAGADGVPMPLWHHTPTGRVWADIAGVLDTDLLFVEQLTQGVGIRQSPAYGGLTNSWDAGRPLSQDLVQFRRVGPKVLLVALQTVHRASDPEVQSSVEQSFAQSVLFGFAAHETEDGRLGIDLTELVLRDARGNGIVGDLNGLGGNYVLDVAKSIINPSKTKSKSTFSCLEANITAADATGGVRKFGKSLADPAYITIAVRRTFVVLPPLDGPDAFTPRPFIPKSSFSSISFTDEAAPLLSSRTKKYITRHRIGGVDPGRALQDGAGILYYVDRVSDPVCHSSWGASNCPTVLLSRGVSLFPSHDGPIQLDRAHLNRCSPRWWKASTSGIRLFRLLATRLGRFAQKFAQRTSIRT